MEQRSEVVLHVWLYLKREPSRIKSASSDLNILIELLRGGLNACNLCSQNELGFLKGTVLAERCIALSREVLMRFNDDAVQRYALTVDEAKELIAMATDLHRALSIVAPLDEEYSEKEAADVSG